MPSLDGLKRVPLNPCVEGLGASCRYPCITVKLPIAVPTDALRKGRSSTENRCLAGVLCMSY